MESRAPSANQWRPSDMSICCHQWTERASLSQRQKAFVGLPLHARLSSRYQHIVTATADTHSPDLNSDQMPVSCCTYLNCASATSHGLVPHFILFLLGEGGCHLILKSHGVCIHGVCVSKPVIEKYSQKSVRKTPPDQQGLPTLGKPQTRASNF